MHKSDMSCAESSHANVPKPSSETSPPLPAAGSAEPFRSISTKLPDRSDDFPASSSSPLRWIQTKVLTPVRESMRRMNVTPIMMTTLSGVRRKLINDLSADQASKSTPSSSSSPDPNLLSNDLSQRALSPPECPPTNANAMSLPGTCTQVKQADCPAQVKQAADPAAQEKQAAEPTAQAKQADCPAQVKQAAEPTAQAKQADCPAQAKQAVETANQTQTPSPGLPAKQEEYNPSIAAVLYADQGKIHSLENKVNHFSNALSEQGAAANQTAAELSLQCDRIRFNLEHSQQSQTTALQACMHRMQGTMDAQGQATGQLQKNIEGLFIMLSDMQQSFQSSNVLPTAAAAAPAAAAITESPPLMREKPFEENPEATEALLLAQSFLLSGTESIDQKIFSRFNIATVDQATYSRHKGKYADIRPFTESICKDDPSIEAALTDALLQQGTVKTAALQNLREKLGTQNHRTQILGDLMLLYLLMRPSTDSAIKESMNATCRDFILQGHSELTLFIKRCQTGQSLLLRNVTARERDAAIARGLSAVQHPQFCTARI